jgi:hypothetical protein
MSTILLALDRSETKGTDERMHSEKSKGSYLNIVNSEDTLTEDLCFSSAARE